MTDGGRRDRLIGESLTRLVRSILDARGWFDPGRVHAPIEFNPSPVPPWDQIPPNTITVTAEDVLPGDDLEMGSLATERSHIYWVDIYGDPRPLHHGDSLARELAGDIRAGLEGHLSSIGRTHNGMEVWDWSAATPYLLFGTLLDVEQDRGRDPSQPSRLNWIALTVMVTEEEW